MVDKTDKIQLIPLIKGVIIGGIVVSVSSCSFFRDRESDYLREPVYQTEGVKVPDQYEKTNTINPALKLPSGQDKYQVAKAMPDNLVPPGYTQDYPIALLTALKGHAADSNLTFVKNKYGLLVINAPLNESYALIAKELTSIPDIQVIKQSQTGHSFKIQSSNNQKIYWIYLTLTDKKSRLSIFDKNKNLVADDEVYGMLTQLNSRIQALYQGGDYNIQVQYPLLISVKDNHQLLFEVKALMPNAETYLNAVLTKSKYNFNSDKKELTIPVTITTKDKKQTVEEQTFKLVNQASALSADTIFILEPEHQLSISKDQLNSVKATIDKQAKETFITEHVSLLSVSSQLLIDQSQKKAYLVVPMPQSKAYQDIERSIKRSKYFIVRKNQDNGFFFITLDQKEHGYQYLIYVRAMDEDNNQALVDWLSAKSLTNAKMNEAYVEVFDKQGNLMSLSETQALLITLQNNL
ncbi:hypothetical protein L3V79_04235 [Thiotrichales bacterium 19S9-12]|nr:hypothetical protein [Thiotrichales bacterium 19S9-11]MCF6811566.1 hypothetical protein [Thiotrichales bacterium 19S9-12]